MAACSCCPQHCQTRVIACQVLRVGQPQQYLGYGPCRHAYVCRACRHARHSRGGATQDQLHARGGRVWASCPLGLQGQSDANKRWVRAYLCCTPLRVPAERPRRGRRRRRQLQLQLQLQLARQRSVRLLADQPLQWLACQLQVRSSCHERAGAEDGLTWLLWRHLCCGPVRSLWRGCLGLRVSQDLNRRRQALLGLHTEMRWLDLPCTAAG